MSLSPFPPSPLVLVEQALRRLDHGPGGFTINPAELGLPAIPAHPGGLSVLQVRDILARQATPIEVKNRAWAALIARTQHDKPVWTLAALGIALPRLRRVSRVLTEGYRGCPADLDAEILTGFLTALAGARTDRQQRFPALVRAARSAGLAWARQCRLAATTPAPQLTAGTGEDTTDPPTGDATGNTAVNVGMGDPGNDTVSAPVSHASATVGGARSGHPDLVLADAVAAGIITATEAEIIAATRLEQRPLREVASTYRISVNTLWMRRDRAEKRLVTELTRAIAADDTDRATDPTHAHLLATTPLGQRLEQQADQPASTRQAPTPPTPVQPGAPADSRADAPRRHPLPALATASADMATTATAARRSSGPATRPGHTERAPAEHGHDERRPGIELARACGHAHLVRPPAGHRQLERPDPARWPSSDQPDPEPNAPDAARTSPSEETVRVGDSRAPSSAHSHPHPTTGARAYPSPRHRRDTPAAHAHRRCPGPPVTALLVAATLTLPTLRTGTDNLGHPTGNPPTAHAPDPRATSAAFTVTSVTPTVLASHTTTSQATAAPTPRLNRRSTTPSGPGKDSRPGGPAEPGQHDAPRATRPVPLSGARSVRLAPAQGTPDGTAQLTRVLNNLRNWLMGVLITLATLCLTVGGVRYLIAAGDPGEVEAAKRAIKSAAIGYALAALAPALVAVLRNLVGV